MEKKTFRHKTKKNCSFPTYFFFACPKLFFPTRGKSQTQNPMPSGGTRFFPISEGKKRPSQARTKGGGGGQFSPSIFHGGQFFFFFCFFFFLFFFFFPPKKNKKHFFFFFFSKNPAPTVFPFASQRRLVMTTNPKNPPNFFPFGGGTSIPGDQKSPQ